MEVALDPPSLLVARRDDSGAGLLYERELRTQLCLEPSVLESQVGGGSDCVHELALLLEGTGRVRARRSPRRRARSGSRHGGFVDVWTGSGGLTCCHAVDLHYPGSTLTKRMDLVLTKGGFNPVAVDVVGEESADRTASGLWPSDHAGVVATLQIPG